MAGVAGLKREGCGRGDDDSQRLQWWLCGASHISAQDPTSFAPAPVAHSPTSPPRALTPRHPRRRHPDCLATSTQLAGLDTLSLTSHTTPPPCPRRLHHHLPLRRQALPGALLRRRPLRQAGCPPGRPRELRKAEYVQPSTRARAAELLLMTQTGSTAWRYSERRKTKESHPSQRPFRTAGWQGPRWPLWPANGCPARSRHGTETPRRTCTTRSRRQPSKEQQRHGRQLRRSARWRSTAASRTLCWSGHAEAAEDGQERSRHRSRQV